MPDYLKVLIQSVLTLGTATVAAYLSARWGLRRAFQEKWWERKERAYTEIIEALYDLIRYSDLCAEEDKMKHRHEHSKKKEFGERYSEAYWKIQKMTDIGAFVISDEAARILRELRKRPQLDWNNDPPWENYEADSSSYRNTLDDIRKCAKMDLKMYGR